MSERGGRTPEIGRHSTMLNPDSVSRVIPPTTTILNTRAEDARSQFETEGGDNDGSGGSCCSALDTKGAQDPLREDRDALEASFNIGAESVLYRL